MKHTDRIPFEDFVTYIECRDEIEFSYQDHDFFIEPCKGYTDRFAVYDCLDPKHCVLLCEGDCDAILDHILIDGRSLRLNYEEFEIDCIL